MTDSLLIAILVLTAINTVTYSINVWLRWQIVDRGRPAKVAYAVHTAARKSDS